MLYHITSREDVIGDEYGMYGTQVTTHIVRLTEGYPEELANWFRKNQVEDWLKHNCSYYTKTWSSGAAKGLTIEFHYAQHLAQFRKIWL